jgi:raffinose/stachyose/melibiose transport system substrate-binding protein
VQLWLDTTYGSTVGTAMNDGIVAIFAGTGTAQDVVEKMKAAAQK